MKKQVVVDLITSHYSNDPIKFFNATLEVLKEFKNDGDKELFNHIHWQILSHLKVAPKRDEDTYQREMTPEEYEKYFDDAFNLVPQEEHY